MSFFSRIAMLIILRMALMSAEIIKKKKRQTKIYENNSNKFSFSFLLPSFKINFFLSLADRFGQFCLTLDAAYWIFRIAEYYSLFREFKIAMNVSLLNLFLVATGCFEDRFKIKYANALAPMRKAPPEITRFLVFLFIYC